MHPTPECRLSPNAVHDGRESTLENQIWQPLLQANEMANPSIGFVLTTIREAEDYGVCSSRLSSRAHRRDRRHGPGQLPAGLVSADSAFDRWHFDRTKTQ